nr:LysR family transcriptional regulator [Bacilli bacterium]
MELRWLQYALEVDRYKSFTKAAHALSITQPSLSQQIQKLEQELGIRLFHRGHGPLSTTQDGMRFIEQARQIVLLSEDLVMEMNERRTGRGGNLRIGAPAITGGHVLPPLLRHYATKYPDVAITLVEESTDELEAMTLRGEIDLCVLALPIDVDHLKTRFILREPLYLALPREAVSFVPKDRSSAMIALHDLAEAPFILLKKGYGFRHTVLELCAKSGFSPKIAFETSSVETAQAMAANGLGITIVPQMVMQNDAFAPSYVAMASQPTRTLVFAYRRDRYLCATAQAFLQLFDEVSLPGSEQKKNDPQGGIV